MLGPRPHDEVLSLVAQARLFVLPSFHEGLPIALLEALSLGKPVVASDIEPHREILTHGVNGFLFRTGDSQSLADVLDEVWALGPEALAAIGARGRETVERDYSWDHALRATLDAYRSLGVSSGSTPAQDRDENLGNVAYRRPGDRR